MATLIMLAANAPPSVPHPIAAPVAGVTAEQAMANYRAMLHQPSVPTRAQCAEEGGGDIVVCANQGPSPRLPLAEREPGEVVHHLGEPGRGDPGPPLGPPSKQMQTVVKGFHLLRSIFTGEDPNPE